MADEKTKVVTDATGPDAGPAPVQPEAGGGAPAPKQEQPAPEAGSPDKAPAPEQAAPAQTEKGADAPKEQKAASVSVFNFSEIMAEKKAAEKAAAQQEAKTPDTSTMRHTGGMFVSTRAVTLPPAAMCSTIRANSLSTIPGWTIFQTNTVSPMSMPGTRKRKPAPSWQPLNSFRRPRLSPIRTRRGLPMRNGRPRANLARGLIVRAALRGPPGFPDPPGGKEAVCRNM